MKKRRSDWLLVTRVNICPPAKIQTCANVNYTTQKVDRRRSGRLQKKTDEKKRICLLSKVTHLILLLYSPL